MSEKDTKLGDRYVTADGDYWIVDGVFPSSDTISVRHGGDRDRRRVNVTRETMEEERWIRVPT